MSVDLVGALVEMGFSESGRPKGFNQQGCLLTLWIDGPGAVHEIDEVQSRVERLVGVRCTQRLRDGSVAITCPEEPQVWVVSADAKAGIAEQRRWSGRGYRTTLVEAPPVEPQGLVVSLTSEGPRYQGHLPRHPYAGQMAQSWH